MHYALVVGNNGEWPEQRCTRGDIGLARCLSGLGLPKARLVELYDERATRSNVLGHLDRILEGRNAERAKRRGHEIDTLLIYYGGHGKRSALCTHKGEDNEPWVKHHEVIDLIESKFEGGVVWLLLDTCHAGGFGEALMRRREEGGDLNARYGCVMGAPPGAVAGMEWTLPECFVRAFAGRILCSNNKDEAYYLSTRKGAVHAVKPGAVRDRIDYHHAAPEMDSHKSLPTWEQVIEFLVDERVRVSGNRMTTLFLGEGMEDGVLLCAPCSFVGGGGGKGPLTSVNKNLRIQRDDSWREPFIRDRDGRPHVRVGDFVYVKSNGRSHGGAGRYRIGWFLGHVASIDALDDASANGTNGSTNPHSTKRAVSIEIYDAITKDRWKENVLIKNILGGQPFGIDDAQPCVNAVARLARHLAYIDTTMPPRTRAMAPYSDGKYYGATTIGQHEIPWDEIDAVGFQPKAAGPCVPIRWDDDGSTSFVPTCLCKVNLDENTGQPVSKGKAEASSLCEESARCVNEQIATPLDAMMASFKCGGKALHGDGPVLVDGADETSAAWEAYDSEDCKWLKVQLMNELDASLLPLKVLAYHMCYHESGNLVPVYWESDSTLTLIPTSCLRQRACSDDDNDDNDDDDECSTEPDDGDYQGEVNRYKERAAADVGKMRDGGKRAFCCFKPWIYWS